MDCKFTIIIPYHASTKTLDFVKRQVSYYNSKTISVYVILAVSGDERVKVELENFIKEKNNSNFEMLSINEIDATNIKCFVKKILEALKRVKTQYVSINGADDVIILEEVEKGIKILETNLDVAAVKGHTIYYNRDFGNLFNSMDLEISNNLPLDRLKLVLQDRESIFYIIRRTEELLKEYENIYELSNKSEVLANSFYHIEHFKSLSLAALGKVYVFESPWRLLTTHSNNHTSYVPASFVRVKLGPIEKVNYQWFQSVTHNMEQLGYARYRFWWVCHQIKGIHLTLKQILYNFLHKECNFKELIRILAYYSLNKIFILLQKVLPASLIGVKQILYGNTKDFVESKYYNDLKKYYFTDKDIQLIESNIN